MAEHGSSTRAASSGKALKVGVVVNEDKVLGSGLEELRAALADLGHADPPWYTVSKSKEAPKKICKLVEDHRVNRVLMRGVDGGDRDRIKKFKVKCVPAAVRICQPHLSAGALVDTAHADTTQADGSQHSEGGAP